MPSGGVPGAVRPPVRPRRRRRRRRDAPTVTPRWPGAGDGGGRRPSLVRRRRQPRPGQRGAFIGRDNTDLVLDDDRVSRRHAVVRAVDGGLEIEDLNSANGTSVNGVAISGPRRLRKGDVIQIGGVRLAADPGGRTARSRSWRPPERPAPPRDQRAARRTALRHRRRLIIGRQDSDLLLDDPQVSRRHAVVRAVDGELEVEDLGSANGTFVNGARVDGPHLCATAIRSRSAQSCSRRGPRRAASHGDRLRGGLSSIRNEQRSRPTVAGSAASGLTRA